MRQQQINFTSQGSQQRAKIEKHHWIFEHCTMLLELFHNTLLHTPEYAYTRCVTFHQHWVKTNYEQILFHTLRYVLDSTILGSRRRGMIEHQTMLLTLFHYTPLHTLTHAASRSIRIG